MSPGARFCPSCGLSLEKKNGTKSEIAGYDKDKKTIAGILAILLGGIGVHYFYLGKTTAGLITILLTCCTCGFWAILMFIQGIMMLVISDEDFYSKFVNTDRSFPLF